MSNVTISDAIRILEWTIKILICLKASTLCQMAYRIILT